MLEETENWLYEDGEDQPKQVYEEKLEALKVHYKSLQENFHLNIHFSTKDKQFISKNKIPYFPEAGPAHSGPAQRARGQAEGFRRAGKEAANLHEGFRFL